MQHKTGRVAGVAQTFVWHGHLLRCVFHVRPGDPARRVANAKLGRVKRTKPPARHGARQATLRVHIFICRNSKCAKLDGIPCAKLLGC
ncbi:MAG: hypothetical protein ACK55Z_38010 [bacterium]